MDKYLQKYNFANLNEEEAESLNRPITTDKIKAVIKRLPKHTKKPWTGQFHRIILQNIQGRANLYPPQTIPKHPRRYKTPKFVL